MLPDSRSPIRARVLVPIGAAALLFAVSLAVLVTGGGLEWVLFWYPIGAACGVALVIAFMWRDRLAGAVMLVSVLVVAGAHVPTPSSEPLASVVARWIQFVRYRGRVRALSGELERRHVSPPVAVQPIDGFMTNVYGIAYDPTGQIMLPVIRRTDAWRRATRNTELVDSCQSAEHITGAYYWWFTC